MKLFGFVLGFMAMLAGTAFAAEYNFRLAHEVAVDSTQHLAATRFAELVKERTNGAIEIKVFPNSSHAPFFEEPGSRSEAPSPSRSA